MSRKEASGVSEKIKRIAGQLSESMALCDQISGAEEVERKRLRVSVLVDCYSVYLSLFEFFDHFHKKHQIDESAVSLEEISEVAFSLILQMQSRIEKAEIQRCSLIETQQEVSESADFAPDAKGAITRERLFSACSAVLQGRADSKILERVRTVVEFEFSFDWFFAPFPRNDVLRWFQNNQERAWSNKNESAIGQLASLVDDARQGIVTVHNNRRDYSVYDDFISTVSDRLTSKSNEPQYHRGKYNFYVCNETNRLKTLNEKQVDVLITMRAMDIQYEGMTDALCIISGDTDFLPIIDRFVKEGSGAYYCDFNALRAKYKRSRGFNALFEKGMFLSPMADLYIWENGLAGFWGRIGKDKAAAIRAEIDEIYAQLSQEMEQYLHRTFQEMEQNRDWE